MTEPAGAILFLLRNLYYLRNFEAPIRALAARGHRIVVLADPTKRLPAEIREQKRLLETELGAGISFAEAHGRLDFRQRLADDIHTARDILRFYTPAFRGAELLRRRAAAKATPFARSLYDRPRYWDPAANRRADDKLRRWDESLPLDRAIVSRITAIDPKLVVVSPLVDLRTDQIDWIRAARSLGIPTVLAVASWDNLTSKSRIQVPLDRVIVWNEIQRREAIDLHDVEPERVTVTGAQLYDDWFTRKPSIDRKGFCAAYGFDPARRIILYVGSSTSIAANEAAFIARWLEALRARPEAELASANVLIRPHPMNPAGYDKIDLSDLAPATLMTAQMPVIEATRTAYFDALFHTDLIVGLNTSALVEASILGKGSHTLSEPGQSAGQQETLHYHYLTAARLLNEAPDLPAHLAALADALQRHDDNGAAADFVAEFIRPLGRDKAATPIFVDAIENAIAEPRRKGGGSAASGPITRAALNAVAAADQTALSLARRFRRLTGGAKRDHEPR